MTQLIAIGITETQFSDVAAQFTVAPNTEKVLYIKGPAGKNGPPPSGVYFEVAHQTSGGDWSVVGTVDASNIAGNGRVPAGTWSTRRLAAPTGHEAAGLDVEG